MTQLSRHRELHAGFHRPDPGYSPTPLWWWSGDQVELDRLCRQIDHLVEQGVYNAVVLNLAATGPVHGALADQPALMSPPWWRLWEELCEYAAQRGFRLWFYDQIGFSGANIQGALVADQPDHAGAALARVETVAEPGGRIECPVGTESVAAYAVRSPGTRPVPVPVVDGGAVWSGPGKARLVLVYQLRQGFDYCSPAACAALIDRVHGEFERRLGKYLGTVIAGSFQDELPSLPTWSPGFAAEFVVRAGYRIEEVVAALWEDWGTESDRIRLDYQDVRAALAEAAFFRPLHDWHQRHGLLCGMDQQSPSRSGEPIGSVQQYADYPRTHRWYSAPGSDHWGDAKIHSSLAHHYGRPRTWIEGFHSTGWGGTPEETLDWLGPWLLAGANLYNPHAVYYSTRGGWWEWAPPSTCWRQPYWRHYRSFADTVTRLCWLLSQGEHVCDVAVLFPGAAVAASTPLTGPLAAASRAHHSYLRILSRTAWFNAAPGALERDRRDLDVLDDATLAAATVGPGQLRTRGEAYRAVVVPCCQLLRADTARRLVEFCQAGGVLVFVGELPRHTETADGDHQVELLRDLVAQGRARLVADEEGLAEALAGLARPVRFDGPVLRRRIGRTELALVTAAPAGSATRQPVLDWARWLGDAEHLDYARYHRELREHGYDFDADRNRRTAVLVLPAEATEVEQWDPVTGQCRRVHTRAVPAGREAVVSFDAAPLAVLVWTNAADQVAEETEPAPAPARVWGAELAGAWRIRLEPTMDNADGDFTLPATPGPVPLTQWRPRWRVEPAVTVTPQPWSAPDLADQDWPGVPVTDGVFAWRRGPAPAGELPAPLAPDPAARLEGPGWAPVRYSLSRAIAHDPAHVATLGPKGRVPEEFWRVPGVAAGSAVQLRTMLPCPLPEVTLAVAANGRVEVWWNGVPVPEVGEGYLRLLPVRARAGLNLLELRVHADRAGDLAGYWALTSAPEEFARPEWITVAGDVPEGQLRFRRQVVLSGRPSRTLLHLGSVGGGATLLVNDRVVGRQGGFEPYQVDDRPKIARYQVADWLVEGENSVEVRFTGRTSQLAPAILVDAELTDETGWPSPTSLVSDGRWLLATDPGPDPTWSPVAFRRAQAHDPRWALVRPRPHPLPAASWLEPASAGGGVLETVPDPWAGRPRPAEWFRLVVPPGAHRARLPLVGEVEAWLDGARVQVEDGGVTLGGRPGPGVLALRVRPLDGRSGGALWTGPAEFDCGTGELVAGPWDTVGLDCYSGGVVYERGFSLPEHVTAGCQSGAGRLLLDLGAVRCTAEVHLNGEPVAVRVWSPYRFDLTEGVRPGRNGLTVTVYNTLAPYLGEASPTGAVFAGQRRSGLLGPVRLEYLAG